MKEMKREEKNAERKKEEKENARRVRLAVYHHVLFLVFACLLVCAWQCTRVFCLPLAFLEL